MRGTRRGKGRDISKKCLTQRERKVRHKEWKRGTKSVLSTHS